jgi:cell wall-associated NlpC family hydrolase
MSRFVDSVYLRGGGLSKQLIDAVTSASLNGSISEMNQMDITFADKGWKLLDSGIFSINASVDVEDFQMEIASIDTGDDETRENVTIKCRPRVIRKLKNRRGTRVMKNVSPSEFVIAECRAVGAKYKVQGSAERKQVARDVAKKGSQEVSQEPSSWTTFKRLADDLGYVCFETAGTIYFGRPSWLISEGGSAFLSYRYKHGKDDDYLIKEVPSCTRSADSPGQTVKFAVRTPTLTRVRTGVRFALSGVPTFDTNYLVTGFDIDLADPRKYVNVTGGVAMNPDPQGSGGKQPRRGTRLASDFVYWVRKQIGNKYVGNTQVALGSFDPNVFDGDELAQWAAAQVGVYLPEGANNMIEYCESFGTLTSVSNAAKQAGTILWRNNHIGISLGGGQIIESVKGRVGIRKGGATTRYTRAARVPGLYY